MSLKTLDEQTRKPAELCKNRQVDTRVSLKESQVTSNRNIYPSVLKYMDREGLSVCLSVL